MSELIFSVQGIFDTSTHSGCLEQYGCSTYRIPPYQRGYKWGSEDNQHVERLIRDLTQAWKNDTKEYLLQAITVKKISADGNGASLEVIDGQQRLTTLFIILSTLNHRLSNPVDSNIAAGKLHYAIRHADQSLDNIISSMIDSVGNSTGDFSELKVEQGVAEERCQDSYYLKCAVLRCIHELQTDPSHPVFRNQQDLTDFRNFVLQDVKLMVNVVEPHVSGEVIFGNLNSNRVVLTETELIKGLLLTRVAREPAATRTRQYRETLELRIQLGQKWDELHHWANAPGLKSLYFPAYQDGITGLLELVARLMPEPFKPPTDNHSEKNPLFEYFLQQPDIVQAFRLLSHTHARLQDWYANDKSYHLLGYCLRKEKGNARLTFLVSCLMSKTNSKFFAKLYKQRCDILRGTDVADETASETAAWDMNALKYGADDDRISSILLALSVFNDEQEGRFNFHAFQKDKWSLEHIFPQTPFGKGAELSDEQKNAALKVLTNNEGQIFAEATVRKIAIHQEAKGNDGLKEIDELLKTQPLLHRIGNLCLLTSPDNSAMGCGMFNEKRKVIRDRIALGSFVPRHTYEVFSKMIVGEAGSLEVWSKLDIETHQTEIQKRLEVLMEENV